jgi:formylglycine-generating enzyme required for sulfatase activity
MEPASPSSDARDDSPTVPGPARSENATVPGPARANDATMHGPALAHDATVPGPGLSSDATVPRPAPLPVAASGLEPMTAPAPAQSGHETMASPRAAETIAAPAGAGPDTVATMASQTDLVSDLHITMSPSGSGVRTGATRYARDAAMGLEAEPPELIAGYRRLRRIGAGGMGLVYEAEHAQLKRTVALKLLRPTVAENAEFKSRFLRESKAMAAVQHENVVAIFDAGEASGYLYMALEFVPGGDLAKLLKRRHTLEAREAIDIITACARGLAAIHAAGLVHRDIKPQNIFLDRNLKPKIGDLGLARAADGEDRMTNTGTTWGTPAYMSPEQIRGIADIDIRSDIHALGATLYTLLTGAEPYAGATSFIITHKVLTEPTPDPRALNQLVPLPLAAIVRKAMAKEREDRYQDPTDLVQDLERAKAGDRLLHTAAPRVANATGAPVAAIDISTSGSRSGARPAATTTGAGRMTMPSAPALDPLIIKLIAFGVLFGGLALVAWSVIGHTEVDRPKEGPAWAADAGDSNGLQATPPVAPWAALAVGPVRCRLRWCAPGRFQMGSPADEAGRDEVEVRHDVALSRGFWMAETECTQALWVEVMGSAHRNAFSGPNLPVDSVDWHEANDFCAALSKRCPAIVARLPTEAEWEYACRAGSSAAWEHNVGSIGWVPDAPDLLKAWSTPPPPPDPQDVSVPLTGNPADRAARAVADRLADNPQYRPNLRTHEVGLLMPNAWGLYDMHGNVAEWCSDAWDRRTPYDTAAVTDPDNDQGNCSIVRGGSWFQAPSASRNAARTGVAPDARTDWIGFRFVVTEATGKAKPAGH